VDVARLAGLVELELLVQFYLAALAVAVAVDQQIVQKLALLAVLAQFMAVAVAVVLLVDQPHQVLEVMAVVVALKFTHGDLYEQICTYKQSKHC
jgi:hypothetical protein